MVAVVVAVVVVVVVAVVVGSRNLARARLFRYRQAVQIPGRLSDTTLGDVLGRLLRARVTGWLHLQQASGPGRGRTHAIYLSGGEVLAVDTEARVPTLGEILSQRGLLDGAAQRHLAHRLSAGRRRRVGEVLVDEGRVSPDVIGAALRRQLRAKLEILFGLADALVSFHVVCAPPADPIPLSWRDFLRGRPRARDRAGKPREAERASRRLPLEKKRGEALSMLGLGEDATLADVNRAFRQLAIKLHPDVHVGASDAERRRLAERFAALSAAYHAIVD